jgi:hypothetical protein
MAILQCSPIGQSHFCCHFQSLTSSASANTDTELSEASIYGERVFWHMYTGDGRSVSTKKLKNLRNRVLPSRPAIIEAMLDRGYDILR